MSLEKRRAAKLFLNQVSAGFFFALLAIFVHSMIWHSLMYRHLIIELPGVVLAVLVSRSFTGGVSATVVSLLSWFLYFRGLLDPGESLRAADWIDLGSFVLSAFSLSVLGGRLLPELMVRSHELERLQYAALAAKVGIWEWDVEADRAYWNDQMYQFYGIDRSAAPITSEVWRQRVHPDDRNQSEKEVRAALSGSTEYHAQFRILRPDGGIRVVQASALVRRDSTGKGIAMYGMNRDVTEEVSALEKLQNLSAYFETAISQSPLGVVIAEAPSGRLSFCNDAALSIRRGKREELVDRVDLHSYDPWQIYHLEGTPMRSEETPLAKSILYGDTIRTEVGMKNQEGEMRVILTNTAPIRRADGSIMAAIALFMDNTESHFLIEQLEESKKNAEVAAQAKSRFLDIAAHELRTPVTAFSLLVQMTQKQLADGRPVEAKTLQRLRAQVDRLSRLVLDLLEVSRLDRGMLILKRKTEDIGKLTAECVENFKIQFPDRKFILKGNGRKVEAEIDAVRIYEVISNLLDNAIKYTPKSSLIEILFSDTGDLVEISVRDHGPGISPGLQRFLFSPFERGSSEEHEQYAGLGLGLYICKKIIELHGGSICVSSAEGEGSTFFFRVPKRVVDSRALGSEVA